MEMQMNLIKEFEEMMDYYQVCRDGDRCWVIGKNGKVLKTSDHGDGYRQIGLMMKSGKQKMIREHRLFAICFLENPEDKSEVNHIDGIKSNNSLSNLEWTTRSENIRHADRTGLRNILGENHGCAKLKDSEIPLIFQMRKTGLTLKVIGDHFGIGQTQIHHILSGKKRSQNQPSKPNSLLQF
jgi:hypothetical protein